MERSASALFSAAPAAAGLVLVLLAVAAPPPVRATVAAGGRLQKPGEIQQPGPIQQPGESQQPRGTWQQPGEIQQPKGTWQQPGEIQVPKGIQAIKTQESGCEQRLSTVADALFAFDRAALEPDAERTLSALGPLIARQAALAIVVEGHTDSIGTDAHNQRLSEQRARAVRDWLAAHRYVPADTPIKG